jgi:secondary thiamine-phosphate synthase enzyme
MWIQKKIVLKPKARGFHLITSELLESLPELSRVRCGLAHVFIRHTSASISLNENADPNVRLDFESVFNRLVKENEPYYRHVLEGADDMPAHVKSSILGQSVTIPISDGRFELGVWQGVYLGEHRNDAVGREVVITIHGNDSL